MKETKENEKIVLKSYMTQYDKYKPQKAWNFKIPVEEWEIFLTKARRYTRGNKLALFRIMVQEWEPKKSDIVQDDFPGEPKKPRRKKVKHETNEEW